MNITLLHGVNERPMGILTSDPFVGGGGDGFSIC